MSRTRRTSRTKAGFIGEICKIGAVPSGTAVRLTGVILLRQKHYGGRVRDA